MGARKVSNGRIAVAVDTVEGMLNTEEGSHLAGSVQTPRLGRVQQPGCTEEAAERNSSFVFAVAASNRFLLFTFG